MASGKAQKPGVRAAKAAATRARMLAAARKLFIERGYSGTSMQAIAKESGVAAQTPYYTFTNPNLTWSCTYDNTGDNAGSTVVAGSSAKTNEMCMATGYFFPATGPKFLIQYGGSCHALN